ncbi:MAG TPA: OsmC family protein [Solirubrobacterales bacterium]|jgi:putative redox protein|nr:OsmC family protein [Solirubrobacterales bacterium]
MATTEAKTRVKKAVAKRTGTYEHIVVTGDHRIITDEPVDLGGTNAGPSPLELLAASLASCTATTIEMYANHKEWDLGEVKVKVEYEPAKRGCPTTFKVVLAVPPGMSEEQVQRLSEIAAKCPVHRTLEGEVIFDEQVTIQA